MAKNRQSTDSVTATPEDAPEAFASQDLNVSADPTEVVVETSATAADVIHSHAGLVINQRSEPFAGKVGEIVFRPELGMIFPEIVIDRTRRKGVVDVIAAGEVNRAALSGDMEVLKANPRIKVM